MSTIVSGFNAAAEEYLHYAHIQKYCANSLARWLPQSKDCRILELGAGPGVFTHYLEPWEKNVYATDASEAMCKLGQKNIPAVNWKQMDARKIDNGPWDLICSSSMLQWLDQPEQVLHHWKSVLAPKGHVLCSVFAEGTLSEWSQLSAITPPLLWRKSTEWNEIIRKVGFKTLRHETEEKKFFSSSALEFLKSIHRLGASPKPLLGAGRLRAYINDYERKFTTTSGVVSTWVIYRFEVALP